MIEKINPYNNTDIANKIFFASSYTQTLRGLKWMKDNPAAAACGVDFVSMVGPRSVLEAKERGKQSGIETFIREFSSLSIHAGMGYIGYGSACCISDKFNKKYGIKAQNIFASGDTIQNMFEIWKKSGYKSAEFFKYFLKNLKGLNGSSWKNISNNDIEKFAYDLETIANKTGKLETASGRNKSDLQKEIKNLKSVLSAKITKNTGANSSFKLSALNGSKEISGTLQELNDNAVSLANVFKTKTKEELPDFIKNLKKNKSLSTIIGLGITSLLSISVQPINRMLTKKRTGNDGFVGVDSNENDNSTEFKVMKTLAGIAFPIFSISTIGCKFKDLLSNIQFNSKIPSINQFKFIYGFTISSRLFASRDGNELRESLIKDTLGFSTWLLFGDFVSKLTTRFLGGKELINNPIEKNKQKNSFKYAKDWLMKSSVKSFQEILLPKSKNITKDGKPIGFIDLYKNASDKIKGKIAKAAFAQILGYVFSCLVLGLGIAKLNINITKYLYNKDKAHNNMNKEINIPVNSPTKEINPVFKEFHKITNSA